MTPANVNELESMLGMLQKFGATYYRSGTFEISLGPDPIAGNATTAEPNQSDAEREKARREMADRLLYASSEGL